jgi:glycine hydroxymethyltransferase
LRIGTPALATRGLTLDDFAEVGDVIAKALTPEFEAEKESLRARTAAIAEAHPLYATFDVSPLA